MKLHPGHYVAIFGGAVSGAEAAEKLSRQGIYTVVFEQNALPYGKIEDGLPKWHVKLRDKEEAKVDAKINHPYVKYVPCAALGREIDFEQVVKEWGFSAVLLATGAWQDRPLPVEGVDEYVNKGLYYQNPLIYWYNHYHEPGFDGRQYEIPDETIIVGGGLASVDVVKVVMMETISRELRARGHSVDMFEMEKRGPAHILENLGLTMDDLGLKGCTLYYRRDAHYMPLNTIPEGADERRIEKAYSVRLRMLSKLQNEFLFKYEGNCAPVDKIVENDRLTGLVFQKTEIVDGRVKMIPDAFVEAKSPLVISSIGSIPHEINGVPMKWSRFNIEDETTGKFKDYDHVFALGNAVTGRGNIKESRKHGALVSDRLLEDHLAWSEPQFEAIVEASEDAVAAQVAAINEKLQGFDLLTTAEIEAINQRVAECQAHSGYNGDYEAWREKHLPVRLENMS